MTKILTQDELLEIARKGRPNVRYAKSKNGNAIAGWDTEQGRWVEVAGKLLPGLCGGGCGWIECRFELEINGKPEYSQDDWIE